jgi:hypothetical protein
MWHIGEGFLFFDFEITFIHQHQILTALKFLIFKWNGGQQFSRAFTKSDFEVVVLAEATNDDLVAVLQEFSSGTAGQRHLLRSLPA